ncbi:MAG TPA: hypothetical protein V6C81_26345 [Planktothrix sp.]|jgi:hypothetical protein
MWQGKGRSDNKNPNQNRKEEKDSGRKFIDNHPARQAAGQKSTGKLEVAGGTGVSHSDREAALNKQILVYHESQPADTGNDWMFKLKEDSMQFLAEQRGVQLHEIYRESIYKKGIETLIDKIFGSLQRFMFEFNQIAGGTDLQVTGTISGDVTEVTRYNQFREAEETKTYFRARLSTKYYSLTVRGADGCVEFYLVPTNLVIALSKTEKEFHPMAIMQVKITDAGMMWRMADGVPPCDSLDDLCMWLFSNLVQETKAASRAERDEEDE